MNGLRRRSDVSIQPFIQAKNFNNLIKGDLIQKNLYSKSIETEIDRPINCEDFNEINNLGAKSIDNDDIRHSQTLIYIDGCLEYNYVIHYPSKLTLKFEIFINILIIYSICESLNDLSFKISFRGKNIIAELVWACFVLDFISNFFFIKRKTLGKIRGKKDISLKYCKTWAIIDLVTIIPFRFTNNPNAESLCKCFRILKINRLTRMMEIKKVARYCIQSIMNKNQRFPKLEILFQMVWDLVLIIVYMMLLAYAFACIWWYLSYTVYKYKYVSVHFIELYEFDALDTPEKMLRTMYFITTTLLTVGYGDYFATNKYEMGFCILLVTFGAFIFSYNMALAGSYIGSISNLLQKNANLVKLKKMLGKLEGLKGPIPISLQCSIHSHFTFFWKNDRLGCLGKENKETSNIKTLIKRQNRFFKPLPIQLKKKILDSLFNDYFRHFQILFPKENDFKYHICTFIKPRSITEGTLIISEGCVYEDILMVSQGNVSLNFSDLGESLTWCKTFTGWYILGDYSVVLNKPSYATFKAETNVVAMSIPKGPFEMILSHYFPEYFSSLKEVVKRRAGRLLNLMYRCGFDQHNDFIQDMYTTERKNGVRTTVAGNDFTLFELYIECKKKFNQKLD